MKPNHQITMLKFIKNLSTLSSTHEALQNSNAIDVLIELLRSSRKEPLFVEISNQILTTLFNLCHHNRIRQEEAALSDIIPILKEIVETARPLKEFALPLLCELAHSGKIARRKLWENRGLQFYINMLAERNWMVSALDAIFIWLQEETARVEQYLLTSNFSTAIITAYTSSTLSQSTFQNFLEPLQKIVRLSPPIAASLAVHQLFAKSVVKLRTKDASARLNLLKILRTVCEATEEQCTLLKSFDVYDDILELSQNEPAILARKMAEELIKDCDDATVRASSRGSARGMRRPQSSAGRAGSGSSSAGSSIGYAMTPPTPTRMLSGYGMGMPGTPGRERERTGRSQSSANIYEGFEVPPSGMGIMRSSTAGLSAGGRERETAYHRDKRGREYEVPRRPATSYGPARRDSNSSAGVGLGSLLARENNGGATPPVPQVFVTGSQSQPGSASTSGAQGKSRLPKARAGRLSLASFGGRDSENNSPVPILSQGTQDTQTPTQPPMPKLAIRRRRETSGGEMVMGVGKGRKG